MNKHFEDTRYYLRRAGEHFAAGVREELAPVERTARELTGRERDREPTRTERVREDIATVERTAQRRARGAVDRARRML